MSCPSLALGQKSFLLVTFYLLCGALLWLCYEHSNDPPIRAHYLKGSGPMRVLYTVDRSQQRMLRRRREKTNLILAAIVILFVFCQSLRLAGLRQRAVW